MWHGMAAYLVLVGMPLSSRFLSRNLMFPRSEQTTWHTVLPHCVCPVLQLNLPLGSTEGGMLGLASSFKCIHWSPER